MKQVINLFKKDARAWIVLIAIFILSVLVTNNEPEISKAIETAKAGTPTQGFLIGLIVIALFGLVIHVFSSEK